jgi:hypothetical protein
MGQTQDYFGPRRLFRCCVVVVRFARRFVHVLSPHRFASSRGAARRRLPSCMRLLCLRLLLLRLQQLQRLDLLRWRLLHGVKRWRPLHAWLKLRRHLPRMKLRRLHRMACEHRVRMHLLFRHTNHQYLAASFEN